MSFNSEYPVFYSHNFLNQISEKGSRIQTNSWESLPTEQTRNLFICWLPVPSKGNMNIFSFKEYYMAIWSFALLFQYKFAKEVANYSAQIPIIKALLKSDGS